MSITRAPRPEADFYVLSKGISEDVRLSWAARGLLVFLLGKPDHWRVSVAHLVGETAECTGKSSGRDGVYAILTELVTVGYIARSQSRQAGRLGEAEYVVHEVAKPPRTEKPDTADSPCQDLPDTAAPDTAAPDTADPSLVKTDLKQGLKKSKDGGKTAPPWVDAAKAVTLPDWLLRTEWEDYVDHRAAVKAPLTIRACELAIIKLIGMHVDGVDAVESIRQTIRSGKWTDLYAPKGTLSQRMSYEDRSRQRTREFSGDLVVDRGNGAMPAITELMPRSAGGQDAIAG